MWGWDGSGGSATGIRSATATGTATATATANAAAAAITTGGSGVLLGLYCGAGMVVGVVLRGIRSVLWGWDGSGGSNNLLYL